MTSMDLIGVPASPPDNPASTSHLSTMIAPGVVLFPAVAVLPLSSNTVNGPDPRYVWFVGSPAPTYFSQIVLTAPIFLAQVISPAPTYVSQMGPSAPTPDSGSSSPRLSLHAAPRMHRPRAFRCRTLGTETSEWGSCAR
jgi:hypothetical protein